MREAGRGPVIAAAFAVIAVLFAGPFALADGLPTPLPGAISGPDTAEMVALAAGQGLNCQDQTTAVPPEWYCINDSSLILSATFYADPTLVMVAGASGASPLPPDGDTFLADMAAPFCPSRTPKELQDLISAGSSEVTIYEDDNCRLDLTSAESPGREAKFLTAFAKVAGLIVTPPPTDTPLPTAPPTASPAAVLPTSSPSAAPTPAPAATVVLEIPLEPANRPGGPTAFALSIPAPSQLSTDPIVIATSAVLALLVVLLMPFPAQLFNSTLEENYDELRRTFRLTSLQSAAGRLGGFWDSSLGIVVFVLLSALIYAFLDPDFTFDARGFAVIGGLAIGIVLTTLLASATTLASQSRGGDRGRLRVLPATLLVGLVCVVISRIAGFLPGYVYGVILGFVFAKALSKLESGRANAIAAAFMVGVSIFSWLLLSAVSGSVTGLAGTLVTTVLAALVVAGLEGVVFGMLPFRFLPGESVHATNRFVWAGLLGVGTFLFLYILINPSSGYLSSTSRTPFLTIVVLFLGFAAASVAFWAYFRRKPA